MTSKFSREKIGVNRGALKRILLPTSICWDGKCAGGKESQATPRTIYRRGEQSGCLIQQVETSSIA